MLHRDDCALLSRSRVECRRGDVLGDSAARKQTGDEHKAENKKSTVFNIISRIFPSPPRRTSYPAQS